MPLAPGTHLGPYEILAPLGAGGMGEVYRARDSRLGREVAVKIVPPSVASDPSALARFEREARAVAALSHPNILTLHDFSQSNGTTYAVMELLEGETLRARLESGALPLRKATDIAAAVARGLAAAHDRHIAHRDLKPENIFITTDGLVKILDFGLARHVGAIGDPTASPTQAVGTAPGVVLGTVGYMSPEQVRGEGGDHRADIFALGAVLYEMVTGRRAFQRETAAETMTAILKEDPPDPSTSGSQVPPAIMRIVRRCLEKRPEERFQSTRDLAFGLDSALEASSGSAMALPVTATRPVKPGLWLLTSGLLAGTVIGWYVSTRWPAQPPAAAQPRYTRLTSERGTIRAARFTPDGQSVVYSAAWEGNPVRVFMTRTDAPASVRLSVPDAHLFSVSKSGEMAISLGHTFEGWMGMGTLARSSVLGNAPRVLLDRVREADWTPDGADLVIVRQVGTLEQLESPIGHVLYKTSGYVSDVRFSPSGDLIAFSDHPLYADDAGTVAVIDREGHRTTLSDTYNSVRGLAWSRDGSEIWYSAAGPPFGIFAVTPKGERHRVVLSTPSRLTVLDVAGDGRVLVVQETSDRRVEALMAGDTTPEDVTFMPDSSGQWISEDGTILTISDQGSPNYKAYLMRKGGSLMMLGDGQPYGISTDGHWVVSVPTSGSPVLLHSTGGGQTRQLPNPEHLAVIALQWLPDSHHIVMFAQAPGEQARGYVQDIDGGNPKAFTPPGANVGATRWWALPVSPDGARVVARNGDGVPTIYRLADGQTQTVPGMLAADVPIQWSDDGRSLFVGRGPTLPWTIERADIVTGRRTPMVEIRANEKAGLRLSVVAISRNGRYYVHSFSRLLTDLYVVEGLK